MAFTKMEQDVEIVSKMKDRPWEPPNGLSAAEIKEKFDEAGKRLKAFINTHIDELGRAASAGNIGAIIIVDGEPEPTTLQDILNLLVTRSKTAADDSIPTGAIKDNAVTTPKIKDAAVTSSKIASNAVTAKKIAANAVSRVYNGTLLVAAWDGNEAPYHQAVTIDGIAASDEPIIDLVSSSTFETAAQEDDQWGNIYKATTAENTITFYAKEKPTVALSFKARCIRK
jgi:hypothetical protein